MTVASIATDDTKVEKENVLNNICAKVTPAERVPYSVWKEWLEYTVAQLGGWEIVEGTWVKPGSNNIRDAQAQKKSLSISVVGKDKKKGAKTSNQFRAQYGRANSSLVQTVIEQTEMKETDRFIDIGSGIGQVAMQVACTVGCSTTGIEVVNGRHACAMQLQEYYIEFLSKAGALVGDCRLILGDFIDTRFHELILSSTVVFVNNACGTFGSRCVESGNLTLDYHVASLVKQMKIGTRVVAFDRLLELERPELADVFYCREFDGGSGATDWTEKSNKNVGLFYYLKKADSWICKKCTYGNPLVESDGLTGVESCQMCKEDPAGMRRSYALRTNTKTKRRARELPKRESVPTEADVDHVKQRHTKDDSNLWTCSSCQFSGNSFQQQTKSCLNCDKPRAQDTIPDIISMEKKRRKSQRKK